MEVSLCSFKRTLVAGLDKGELKNPLLPKAPDIYAGRWLARFTVTATRKISHFTTLNAPSRPSCRAAVADVTVGNRIFESGELLYPVSSGSIIHPQALNPTAVISGNEPHERQTTVRSRLP